MANRLNRGAAERLRVGAAGRLVLPHRFRKSLGVKPGDEVVAVLEEGRVVIMSREQAWKSAQEIVRRYVPKGLSLADELIAERRREAARE